MGGVIIIVAVAFIVTTKVTVFKDSAGEWNIDIVPRLLFWIMETVEWIQTFL